ncbi:MAG: hypothetical protein AAB288_04240 [Acidobacteriota bacterium]
MKQISSFLAGFLLCCSLVLVYSVSADDSPKIVGNDGELIGIDVITPRGETLCQTPSYRKADKHIICDFKPY